MSIGAAEITGIITQAEAMFPAAVLTMYYGTPRTHSVQVLQSESPRSTHESDLGGTEPGARLRLRLILSRCDPWTPPGDTELVELHTAAGVKLGVYTVLSHSDDPQGYVRALDLGEETA